ncbi:Bro-N domain-containing protein [Streptomyces sp. NRRL WC-3742]|uniref:BRO-N domain-containing protein n=1 Tax=Streptomyces sp. NRRL WC-3742 TaxID=1463934 RepID=UPI0004C8217A|nr:Bro-N domain-containing protein [Streptomyces sp. NRRL WC-3742]
MYTADVCRVLGRRNPADAVKRLEDRQHRIIDMRLVTIAKSDGYQDSAGQKPYAVKNPLLGVVSEAGLYSLLMRSNKATSRPFRDWVTEELLPSVRRGDTDIPTQQRRMAETLAEAIGQQVEILAELDRADGPQVYLRSDGTVYCKHGEMLYDVPSREDDSGPPFGGYYSCPSVERVGIRGGTAIPRCVKIKIVDLVRMLLLAPKPTEVGDGQLTVELHGAVIHGTARQISDLMREYGR